MLLSEEEQVQWASVLAMDHSSHCNMSQTTDKTSTFQEQHQHSLTLLGNETEKLEHLQETRRNLVKRRRNKDINSACKQRRIPKEHPQQKSQSDVQCLIYKGRERKNWWYQSSSGLVAGSSLLLELMMRILVWTLDIWALSKCAKIFYWPGYILQSHFLTNDVLFLHRNRVQPRW